MNFRTKCVAAAVSALLMGPALTLAATVQKPIAYGASALDTGAAPADAVIDVAISLNLVDRAGLESYIASTADRTSRNFRKFLTPQQFAARYGQPDAVIAQVTDYLTAQGFTISKVFENKLVIMAKATNAQASAVFGTPIHTFVENGKTSQRPTLRAAVPQALAGVVSHVAGLSSVAPFHPHLKTLPAEVQPVAAATSRSGVRAPAATLPTPGIPGQYTVGDLANLYNITPLYQRGLTGAGRTLGIMTFASFTPADAGVYWTAVGLSGSTSRISVVNVIPGSTIGTDGADETTLDVEQSGGVAPGANVIVYEAPNTDAGSLALFTQAITDNIADTLSISWGEAELYYDPADLLPYDSLLLQAASQGIPVTASSGDEGAYDLNYSGAYPYPNYSSVISVDYWSSSPYVIAAGGTTLPVTLSLAGGTTIKIPSERPWAWDYLRDYLISRHNQAYYYANYFPVGGGGGVSVQYPLPAYQVGLAGIQTSAPGQSLFCFVSPTVASGANTCTPGTDVLDAPAGYAGRNTPDVSLNADPETGYTLYYSGTYTKGYGGTSFVAPQLNGIFALISQQIGGRIGWPHPQLYAAFRAQGYGTGSPFRPITSGSNLFYTAATGFNPASGIGSLDVNNLSNVLGH